MNTVFTEKEKLFDDLNGLCKYKVSKGRINYKYEDRVIIKELNPNTGNGYICGKFLEDNEYKADSRGWINIKAMDKKQLKDLLEDAMISFLVYL